MDSAKGLIVIQTHLILASGKLVLQKKISEEEKARSMHYLAISYMLRNRALYCSATSVSSQQPLPTAFLYKNQSQDLKGPKKAFLLLQWCFYDLGYRIWTSPKFHDDNKTVPEFFFSMTPSLKSLLQKKEEKETPAEKKRKSKRQIFCSITFFAKFRIRAELFLRTNNWRKKIFCRGDFLPKPQSVKFDS